MKNKKIQKSQKNSEDKLTPEEIKIWNEKFFKLKKENNKIHECHWDNFNSEASLF